MAGLSLLACGSPEARSQAGSKAPVSESGAAQAPFDVEAVIRQVHFSYRPEQDGWRGGHSTYEVKATSQGITLTPLSVQSLELADRERPEEPSPTSLPSADEAEQGAPLVLGTARVVRGDTVLSVEEPQGQVEADGHLTFSHGAFVEHLRNSEQGVEQSWSFDTSPRGQGELRVRIPVTGLVHTRTSDQGLHFADAQTGLGFRYGHGTWVDGNGQRTPLPAEYVDGQIQLRVPEAVLAASAYPAVLDPVVTQEMFIDGRLVTGDTAVRTSTALAFDGQNFLVVWRNVRGNRSSIYGTRVSGTGTVLDSQGIVVSNGPGNVAVPFVAAIEGAGFYVVWAQNSHSWKVMGTHVSASGAVAHPGGEPLSSDAGNQYWPRLASNGSEYLVAWYRYTSSYDADIYARRVSGTGLLYPAEIPIATGLDYNESTPSVASNGGMYLVGWNDERSGSSRAYATRVSNAGAVLDGTGFPLSLDTLQYSVTLASNGEDFLAVWLDYRSGTDRDVYGTRINDMGTVVDASGLAIGAVPDIFESYPAVASDGVNYLVAWTAWDTSNSTFQNRASRVLSSSSPLAPVQDSPSLVLSPSGTAHKYPAVAKADSGYLVAWEGNGSTLAATDLYSAQVSSTGAVTAGGGFSVTPPVSALHQAEPAVASNGSNYLVVWTETGSGGTQIYGARVTRQGGTIDVPPLAITASVRERQTPAVTSNGEDYFVVWMDYRDVNWDIYGARVRGSGPSASALRDPNGFVVSAHPDFQNAPAVAALGSDYLVVWRQELGGRGDIHGARVTDAGVVQDTSGIAIATHPLEHYAPRVASNGSHYFVVWAEYQSATAWDIVGARVSPAGVLVDTSGIAISTEVWEQYDPDVASNGTDFFVVWTDYRSGENNDIYGARVTGAGVVEDASGLALCTETVQQFSPKVVWDGTNYLAAWADYRWDSYWDVFTTQVTSSGTVVSPGGFGVVYNARATEPHLALASGGGQQSLVTFSRYDTEPGTGSRRVRGQFVAF